jgi:predicted RecB family nuclease
VQPTFPRLDPTPESPLSISPTDVSQFIRLEQCQRFLRLRLHERRFGLDFMRSQNQHPQQMPETLIRSGLTFEQSIEAELTARNIFTRFSGDIRKVEGRRDDNDVIAERAQRLAPGTHEVLGQPRLHATLGGWRLTGDVDLLRLERTASGELRCLITDIKSSMSPRVEHRLQIAFYHEMLVAILKERGIVPDKIDLAILYRGPQLTSAIALSAEEAETLREHHMAAAEAFGIAIGALDVVAHPRGYLESVHDLILAASSTASRVAIAPFTDLPFHLTRKCDSCLFNEFCMHDAAVSDDLSLVPHVSLTEKSALQRQGITRTRDLAALPRVNGATTTSEPAADAHLVQLSRKLATTWPVGNRLDELILRARRYRRFKGEPVDAPPYMPGAGYGSLPYSDESHNPNLVRIFIDVQHDYLNDRLYLLGALVVANEGGVPGPNRRRSIVRLAPAPPTTPEIEADLLTEWVGATLQALVEVAAPDEMGQASAPIHLVFFDAGGQKRLLDALGRHATTVFGATALYDFVTQIAAFTSPIVTHLNTQIRDHKNYPMVCQSLQAVAAYLKFDWNAGTPYRGLFKARLFDFWGKHQEPVDGTPGFSQWYTNRARFSSQIPLEYAHAAWHELIPKSDDGQDGLADFRQVDAELLTGFQHRRLEAMEHIAADFAGNAQTELTPFNLPDLATFSGLATSFAHALAEFVTIERHVEFAAWKQERLASPEQRVLRGHSLILRYLEEDQEPQVAEQNRENERRRQLNETYRAEFRAKNPDAKRVTLSKEQRAESDWSIKDLVFRLRIDVSDVGCDLDEALRLTTIKADDRLIISPRLTVDRRLPVAEQKPFTPTAKQLPYMLRANLHQIEKRLENGKVVEAWAHVSLDTIFGGGNGPAGYVFPTIADHVRPLVPGERYVLDSDPNSWTGLWAAIVANGLTEGKPNRLANVLQGQGLEPIERQAAWVAGQARFLAGLDALREAGAMTLGFEPSKRDYIGNHAGTALLLVQGPPGTGKSFSTAYAVLARIQGAMAAGADFRVLLSCKTHAATDILLENVAAAQRRLASWAASHPIIFDAYFDRRLLTLPLYRYRPRGGVHKGITPLPRDSERDADLPGAVARIEANAWNVTASTTSSVYGLVKDQWGKEIFGNTLVHCLVLDEASQMNLPESTIAALPLAMDGAVIVVGDHRQMPPIVKNDWSNEPRRTFAAFKAYESLFTSLLPLATGIIRFEESFRLHAEMAEFLRREIYEQDKINYHSLQDGVLSVLPPGDSFIDAVLDPFHPLIVVVHSESASQMVNAYEQQLMAPILAVLADPAGHNLEPDNGLGVVVPHRAQRAALQESIRVLNREDPTGVLFDSAVDTVERFQGGEREVILIGVTESDPEYLQSAGKFLFDPRRLTVALSRAKKKLVLVASRSVFEVFSADEETFQNAQLWKNLLRHTCTELLWEGERHGHQVTVWGNVAATLPETVTGVAEELTTAV